MNTKYLQNQIRRDSFVTNELKSTELKYISAAGCCVLYSCWHPEDPRNKTRYPSTYINYDTKQKCIDASSASELYCGYEWHPNKKCNQFRGRVEEL